MGGGWDLVRLFCDGGGVTLYFGIVSRCVYFGGVYHLSYHVKIRPNM